MALAARHPVALPLPSSAGQGDKIRWKISWVKVETGRSLTSYYHRQNRCNLGKINLFPVETDLDSKKQRQNIIFSLLTYVPPLPAPFLLQVAQGDREQGLGSVYNSFSLPFLPSYCFSKESSTGYIFLQGISSCSSMGSPMGWTPAPPWSSPQLQGTLCSGTCSTSSFFSHLGACRAVSHTFSPPSSHHQACFAL